ncbi:hypothetical protein SAMN05444272_3974 [Roseibium suaedae]|uniref:Nudix hydrolase domain-containing protein n=2 Tax=Roseibium suaedae TaxID=735517 RepID=A0A1M7NTW0_9HYPH|nr:hypothetical protein SAMN05444272_3974 [Roseibium suaedae]
MPYADTESTSEQAKADAYRERSVRTQYGALCFRKSETVPEKLEILLITSRETGRWVIPKGWPMRKKKPHQAAGLEAWQEAGVKGRIQKKPCGTYSYIKKMSKGALVPAVVEVFLLEVRELAKSFPEQKQRQRRWFTPEAAASAVSEPELKALIAGLNQYGGLKPALPATS